MTTSNNQFSQPPVRLSRRIFLSLSASGFGAAILASCAKQNASVSSSPSASATASAGAASTAKALPTSMAEAGGMDALIAGAKAEGELSVIALPNDWANYKEMKESFLKKYPFIKLNDLSPDASSADEIEAIKANKANNGPQNPDTIDVGFQFGPDAQQSGLLQPYKVATWESIPADLKDPDGHWYGDYYGVMAFEVNTQVVRKPCLVSLTSSSTCWSRL